MDNNILLFGGLAAIAVIAFSNKGGAGSGSNTPPGATLNGVHKSHAELLAMGYTYQNGMYIPPQQSQQLANTTPGTPQWQQIMNTIIQTGTALLPIVMTTVQQIQTAVSISTANSATITKVQNFINQALPSFAALIPVTGVWDATTRTAAQQVFGQDVSMKTYTQLQNMAQAMTPSRTISGIQKYANSQTKSVCEDGAFTDMTGRGTCTKHGGIKYHYEHSKNQTKVSGLGEAKVINGTVYI